MTTLVLFSYFSILIILCVYGWHRFHITRLYHKNVHRVGPPKKTFKQLPKITVQLPVFNEKFVIERLIDACAGIDYPAELLQIQVLDDSTDETCRMAKARCDYHRERGVDIEYIHRVDRSGFKAGALENGLKTATGEFVAVFDADFVPNPDILMQTVHYFAEDDVGMVQTRWEHLNREHSLLTQIQAMLLDAHFVIEHGGRCYSNLYFNFNGTAGIWRKITIAEAGGWQHDTLTEDLDLSYRAQLKGWRFMFIPNVTCPAELPVEMTAFKSQQHRWAKGAIQVMLKLLPTIFKSKLPWRVKMEAFFHLTGNMAYILMIINSIFFVIPAMMLRQDHPWWQILLLDGPLFMLASISFVYFYLSAQSAIFKSIKGRKRFIPALMALGIGMGLNNSRAVVEAMLGKESPFVRTPKLGDAMAAPNTKRKYQLPKTGWGYIEMFLGFVYSCAIVWALIQGNWGGVPFLILFQNGFYFIGWQTLQEERRAFGKPTPMVGGTSAA